MGAIGIGGRGTYDLQWFMRNPDMRFVAMCDARRDRREAAKAVVDQAYGNADCATYIDPREMLARDDIDAVLIATSDRWHAMASIMAMRAGKDVFSEKPCAMNVGESRALAETAKEYARVYQAGTQRRSEPNFVFIVQLARLGYLGKLKTLTAHIVHGFSPHVWLPAQPEPPKDEVDYDLYLGPVPWHPYNRGYVDSRHAHADMWAGGLHEWGAHTFDLCQFANDTALTGPVEFVYPNNDTSEGLTARYANGVELVMTASASGNLRRPVRGRGWGHRVLGRPQPNGDAGVAAGRAGPDPPGLCRQDAPLAGPCARLPGLREVAPPAHRERRDRAQGPQHLSCRSHLHGPEARCEVGPGSRGVHRR